MADVTLGIGGDSSKFNAELQKAQAEVEKLRVRILQLKTDSKGSHEEHVKGTGDMAAGIRRVAMEYVSLRAVAELVNEALKTNLELREHAAQATITQADAQRDFLRVLGDDQARQQAGVAAVQAIAAETHVKPSVLYPIATAAVSAQAGLTDEQTMEAVKVAAQMAPHRPEEGRAIVSQLLDIMRNQKATAQQAGGAWQQVQAGARMTPQEFQTAGVPAMNVAQDVGATWQQAGAALSTWRSYQGGRARTFKASYEKFFEALEKDVPGKTFDEKMKKLQDDPRLAAAFIESNQFNPESIPFLKGWLTGQGPMGAARGVYQQRVAAAPTMVQAGPLFER